MKFIMLVLLVFLLSGCFSSMQMGVQDDTIERKISHANDIDSKYKSKDHRGIEKILLNDLHATPQNDAYAKQHLLNQLADLYSYHLLDLERAVEMDRMIAALGNINETSSYRLTHDTANNRMLYAKEYRDKYLNVSPLEISEKSKKRLQKNISLLKAEPLNIGNNYSRSALIQLEKDVKDDITRTYEGSADRFQLVSRLIRVEYELYRSTKDTSHISKGYTYLLNTEMKPSDAYYSEIDFLSLSDYLDIAYRNSGQISLAEYALELTYKPYLRLRDLENRWLYNKLVNTRINTLIKGYYARKDHAKMLYYISLNKSRMILEDKVRTDLQDGNIISVGSDLFDPQTGLPRFELLQKKVAKAENYIDFYMSGDYESISATNKQTLARAQAEASSSFSGTRAIKRSGGANDSTEVFISTSLYITYVRNGKIDVILIDDPIRMRNMHERLDTLYDKASNLEAATRAIKLVSKQYHIDDSLGDYDFAKEFKLDIPESVTISPDGWLSRYPLDWLLNRKTTRTLNLFTYGDTSKINGISMVGYFNPSISAPSAPNNGDLPDAERELDVIKPLVIKGSFFLKSEASLDNLSKPIPRNILHLSMHGSDNADDPVVTSLPLS